MLVRIPKGKVIVRVLVPVWIVCPGIGRVRIASSTHHPEFTFVGPVRDDDDGIATSFSRILIVSGFSNASIVGLEISNDDSNSKRIVTSVSGLRSDAGIVQGWRHAMPLRGSFS